jgi:hypothetical protein
VTGESATKLKVRRADGRPSLQPLAGLSDNAEVDEAPSFEVPA